ncbi:MAG: hypothetical protein DWI12_11590 [Planctomycetota bacterium]|nr:MAG: hypothetical protein DWI12_11590 [Planctomycetota bacterium]
MSHSTPELKRCRLRESTIDPMQKRTSVDLREQLGASAKKLTPEHSSPCIRQPIALDSLTLLDAMFAAKRSRAFGSALSFRQHLIAVNP